MEKQITEYFLWSVYINATTLLIIVGLGGFFSVQVSRALREITALIRESRNDVRDVAAMTRDVATMTHEILRRTE